MVTPIGAVHKDDVWNFSDPTVLDISVSANNFGQAAAVAWVENFLHVPYSFQVTNGPNYIVPTPLELPYDIAAHWMSDIAILKPVCRWASATPSSQRLDPSSSNVSFSFPDEDVSLTYSMSMQEASITTIQYRDFTSMVGTVENTLESGVTLWSVSSCRGDNCQGGQVVITPQAGEFANVTVIHASASDTGGDPFAGGQAGGAADDDGGDTPDGGGDTPDGGGDTTDDESLIFTDVAFLLCQPNAVIDTREVLHDGHGNLTVLDTSYPRQGNLNETQTKVLLSNILRQLSSAGGPAITVGSSALGSESQVSLFFGRNVTATAGKIRLPAQIKFPPPPPPLGLLPIENITETYARMVQSAAKVLLDGAFSVDNVPARVLTEQVTFSSSVPHMIVSTVLVAVSLVVVVVSHFRKSKPSFTLFNIAASLEGSEIPRMAGRVREEAGLNARESDMVKMLGKKAVIVGSKGDGGVVLNLQ
ncbi:hypothetical protein BXZ70DRAFT_942665 [Cristinia sonorae]|uniref:Uncharacterized protein n=1 Tax=Cristinia sonorae TaxID=1940300 RepID=A0A8K0UMW0_9AGAR|nr:hypothetical protein BXZ70DRAFT_942665 [Cristinia sonorae]